MPSYQVPKATTSSDNNMQFFTILSQIFKVPPVILTAPKSATHIAKKSKRTTINTDSNLSPPSKIYVALRFFRIKADSASNPKLLPRYEVNDTPA
jgi:hypothetical protein